MNTDYICEECGAKMPYVRCVDCELCLPCCKCDEVE